MTKATGFMSWEQLKALQPAVGDSTEAWDAWWGLKNRCTARLFVDMLRMQGWDFDDSEVPSDVAKLFAAALTNYHGTAPRDNLTEHGADGLAEDWTRVSQTLEETNEV